MSTGVESRVPRACSLHDTNVIYLSFEFQGLRIEHQFVASFRYLSLLNIQPAMPVGYRFSNSLTWNSRSGWLMKTEDVLSHVPSD
jgi:hypothetical protein